MGEIRLPELGEDIKTAEVVNVYVKKGDSVNKEDPLFELETDKAALDMPSPSSGVISEVLISVGDTIEVSQVIAKIDNKNGSESNKTDKSDEENKTTKSEDVEKVEEKPEIENKKEENKPTEDTQKEIEEKPEIIEKEEPTKKGTDTKDILIAASPSTRKLARELGINIIDIKVTGPGGRISSEDVKKYAKDLIVNGKTPKTVDKTDGDTFCSQLPPLPDFTKWGHVERVPMNTVRKITADKLSRAWTIPHVTQYDKADITELDELRRKNKSKAEKAGGNLTITPILIKVIASALGVFPDFNASIDIDNEELVYKKFINIGFAVDTDRGLLVPNVRNADEKNIIEIAAELSDLSDRARNKKIKPDEFQGSTFTVSNLGGIGGTYFSPIIYFPDVAILGVSRAEKEPIFVDGSFEPRLMMSLSLSYDHRLIDGAAAARFLRWIVEALEEPFKIIFEGEF